MKTYRKYINAACNNGFSITNDSFLSSLLIRHLTFFSQISYIIRNLHMRIAIVSLFIILISSPACFSQLKVSEIQGNEAISPYLDQFIQLDTVIVTATGQGFLFVESQGVELDSQSISSHGLWILYSGPRDYKVNDLI